MRKKMYGLAITSLFCANSVLAATPTPDGANVYIASPAHGEVVQGPVTVKFGLSGMGVAPAGVDKPNTGHHHLLIDVESLPPMDKPIPKDDKHKHFGGGQTEVVLDLPPGEHTLQLLLGDKGHVPHESAVMSEKISVIVK